MQAKNLLLFFLFLTTTLSAQETENDDLFLCEKNAEEPSSPMDVSGCNTSNLTNLEAEPSAAIHGVVSVISGDYTESFQDFIVAGPEALPVQRVYSSGERMRGSLSQGWHLGQYGLLNRWKCDNKKEGKGYRATIVGGGGGSMTYHEVDDHEYELHKSCFEKGLTNTSTGMLSARTNPLNDRLSSDRKKRVFTLKTGAGVVSIFDKTNPSSHILLSKEIKPNGLQTLYNYDKSDRITSVTSKSANGHSLASINYEIQKNHMVTAKANGMPVVTYRMQKIKDHYHLVKVEPVDAPYELYDYKVVQRKTPPVIVKKTKPDGRVLMIDYFEDGKNEVPYGVVDIRKYEDLRLGRVKTLRAPVGYDKELHYIYKFVYSVESETIDIGKETEHIESLHGDTKVYDVYNRMTRYYYNKEKRLATVEKYKGQGPKYDIYSREKLFWNGPYLTNRIFETKDGWAQYCRQYDYDNRGNVWRETLWGNLTGFNKQPIHYPPSGYPEYNNCEIEFKLYSYSDDGLNLMQSMTEGNEVHTVFEYVPGTDLLTKKLSGPLGSIKRREFFSYDENTTLTKHIQDDGASPDLNNLTGVTERHIKITIPTTLAPMGLPAVIEHRYLDLITGEEKLQQRIFHEYTQQGWLGKKEVYDANNALVSTERWEYDGSGKEILFQDVLGRIGIKKYDANKNLIYEQAPGARFHVEYVYDYSNRLLQKETVTEEGQRLFEKYSYDYASNQVSSEDWYGNRTTHCYDEFSRQVKSVYPAVKNINGILYQPESNTEYNELSFPNLKTDANGNSIHQQFTIKGKPFLTVYPDGTQDKIVYNINGTVRKHFHKNGSYSIFEYDYQKRPTKEETYSSSDQLLAGTYKVYTGFQLVREWSLGGIPTEYTYDCSGKLVESITGDSRITFEYDILERRTYTRTFFGPNKNDFIAQVNVYGADNRISEDRQEDAEGNVLKKTEYEYDQTGNVVKTTDHTQSGLSVIQTKFNSLGMPVEVTDACGQISRTIHHYNHHNDQGQIVSCHQLIDPKGNTTTIIKDALGREASITKTNSLGQSLQNAVFFYDGNGNKIRQIDTILCDGKEIDKITTVWEYDCCNRLIKTIEAVDTPEQKQTQMVYNGFGQKEKLIKPDGTELLHIYDELGRLEQLISSDGTVALKYTYDIRGNAVQVDDGINNSQTLRKYDSNNRLQQETLGNGLTTKYEYDFLGRPVKTFLYDGSGVEYTYAASRLHQVSRFDKNGRYTYRHLYSQYDLGGLLLSESYAGNAGSATYEYDQMGRLLNYQSKQFQETDIAYDSLGNLVSRKVKDSIESTPCKYAYDDLSQIIEESGVAVNRYESDSLYNRRSKNGAESVHNALNQLIHDGTSAYSYDLNGNLVSKTSADKETQYTYDAFDRLVSVTVDNKQYRYAYDELNRRLSKTTFERKTVDKPWAQKTSQRFLYHGQNEVGAVSDAGRLIQHRVLGVGKGAEIGATVLVELQGVAHVPQHDHNGNISCLINADTGKVSETYRYSAFGEERLYGKKGELIEASINPWRFSCKRFDEETGFIYFGRRYYSPNIGRWITADPLGFEGGPNLYAYVLNNPLTYFDLYGLIGISGGISDSFGQAFSSLISLGANLIKECLQFPGFLVEQTALHCIPIPRVQDAVRAFGTLMQGKCLCGFETWDQVKSIYGDLGRPEKDGKNRTVIVNGILTSLLEVQARAREISDNLGGVNVHYCYNSSHGFLADVLECGIQKLGVATRSSEQLAKCCEELSAKMGGDGIINLYAHSQGGTIASNLANILDRDIQKCMAVRTFGSATQVEKGYFASVENYVSSRDFVPWLDPIPMLKAWFCKDGSTNTTILNSKEMPFIDHEWNSSTYQAQIMKSFKQQYASR